MSAISKIKIHIGFCCALFALCVYAPTGLCAANYETDGSVATNTGGCSIDCIVCSTCEPKIEGNHEEIQENNSELFVEHRDWMIDVFFREHILYAMQLMSNQLTVVGVQAVKTIGTFFDAKHQLETQRLFQQLMAEAHKDYQPSEGICDIGTNVRGLASSERKTNLSHQTLANRVMERQLRTGDNLSLAFNSDLISRVEMFKNNFCQTTNNANGLHHLCAGATAPRETINKDVNYTRTVDSALTLDIDFSKDSAVGGPDLTPDEKATFALMANLFAHNVLPTMGSRVLADGLGNPRSTAHKYLNLRSLAAKRSVAQNSVSAIISERSAGDKLTDYAQFLKSTIVELGVPEAEVDFVLGKNPSYFAQMEVLTKKLYQNPVFYTELYDKPVNVLRKRAAIRAVGLMQDRDFYKSLLRNEVVLSVALEAMLNDEHKLVYRDLNKLQPKGDAGTQ